MGFLKKLRKARTEKKAALKAAQARAVAEVKYQAKHQLHLEKLLAAQQRKLAKQEHKAQKATRKHETKMAKTALEKAKAGRFNATRVLRYSAALKALAPLALPIIYRGIVAFQEQSMQNRAKRLGITVDELASFSGHGSELKATIAGMRKMLEQFSVTDGFKIDVQDRLTELEKAVSNAEFMTPEQRKRAHHSIANDLDQLNREILAKIV